MSTTFFRHRLQRVPRRWWWIVAALLVLGFAAAALVYYNLRQFDAEAARALLTEKVSAATGRAFTIRGPLELRLWTLRPAIVATDVSLTNPAWTRQPHFIQAKRFAAEFDLLALLGGTLRINRLAFDRPQVSLETDRQGKGNWVFHSAAKASDEPAGRAGERGLTFEIEHFVIDKGVVSFHSGIDAASWQLDLDSFHASGKTRTEPLRLKLEARLNERPFTFTGSLDSLVGLFDASVATGVDLTLRAGGATITAKGTVASLFDASGLDARMTIKGTEVAELTRYFGYELPDLGRYQATGRLGGSVYAPAVQDLVLDVGEGSGIGTLTLKGRVADLVKLNGLDLAFAVQGEELAELLNLFGVEQNRIGSYRAAGRATGSAAALAVDGLDLALGDPQLNGLTARGRIGRVAALNDTDLVVAARFEDVSRAAARFGAQWPALPAALDARVVRRDDMVDLSELRLRVGESDLAGKLEWQWRPRIDRVRGQLHGNLIDLAVLMPDLWEREQPAPARRGRLFSDAPLDWSWMQQRQLDVALSLQRLALYRSFGLHQFSTQVQVREGQLLAAPVRARLAPDGAEIDARLTLTQLPEEPARVAATLVTRGLDISPLLALTERPAEFSGGRVDVNLDLRAQGNSVRALMGSLEGQAQLVVGEALVDRRVFDLGADLLTEFVNLVNPFAKSDAATKLECIAVRLPVKDGVVTIDRSVALQTAKVNIVTSGVVNLRDETLNLYMQSRAREGLNLGLGKVTNMVKVTGTLAKPSYGVSAEGVIEAGLSTAAAVTTAGLSILVESLATKTLSDRTPCRTALGEGKAAKVTPPGSAEPDTAAPVGTTE